MKKIILLMALFSLVLFYGVSAASADLDCNITVPSIVNVGTVINITHNATGGDLTAVAAQIWGMSTSTVNSSYKSIINVTNTTGQLWINWTVPDAQKIVLEDAADWKFNATCYVPGDGDNISAAGEVTSKILDRSKPTAPSNIHPTSTTSNTNEFGGTVIGENTTACTLYFSSTLNPGASSYTMSHSGDECKLTLSDLSTGDYTFYIQASDGSNTSGSSSSVTLSVPQAGGAGGGGDTTTDDTSDTSDDVSQPIGGRNIGRILIDGIKEIFSRIFSAITGLFNR